MEKPLSLLAPPICLAQTKLPELSSLETKISWFPYDVRLNIPELGLKSAVSRNHPVVKTLLPVWSKAIEYPLSLPCPPIFFVQIKLPALSILETKTSCVIELAEDK